MTEAEWLACTDPGPMLEFLRGKPQERRLPRYRRLINWPGGERDRWYRGPDHAVVRARSAVSAVLDRAYKAAVYDYPHRSPPTESDRAEFDRAMAEATAAKAAELCRSMRDIVGDPFRPSPSVDPSWLAWDGGTAPKMARAIYEGRAFGRLPVLADAPEDAGCSDPDIPSAIAGRAASTSAGAGRWTCCWGRGRP